MNSIKVLSIFFSIISAVEIGCLIAFFDKYNFENNNSINFIKVIFVSIIITFSNSSIIIYFSFAYQIYNALKYFDEFLTLFIGGLLDIYIKKKNKML